MNQSVLEVTLSKESRHSEFLRVINGILGLSPKELRVLSEFMALNPIQPCGKEDRKLVKEKLNIQNVNTYVKLFKDKKLIIRDGNNFISSDLIIPPEKGIIIDFNWK